MSVNQQISALTAALRANFWQAWQETAVIAPSDKFTSILPSTTRIEHYPNFSPAPAMTEWDGANDYGTIDSYIYSLENKIYRASLMVRVPDLEDEQTGALATKPKELAVKAKKLPPRQVMKALAAGSTTAAFDGTNFFASSHNFGSGNNSLTYTTADATSGSPTSGNTYRLCALYHGEGTESLKPMIWQNRKGPDYRSNSGTDESDESLQVRMWATLRGVAGYGLWLHANLTTISGLPNVAEMHNILSALEASFRTYQLPKARTSSDGEYVHEQTIFSSANLTLAGSTGLGELLRNVLNQDWAPLNIGSNTAPTTNVYKGFAGYLVSAFLN